MKIDNILLLLESEKRKDYLAKTYGQKLINAFKTDSGIDNMNFDDIPDHFIINRVLTTLTEHINPKYAEWVVKQYCNKLFMMEDMQSVREDTRSFEENIKKLEFTDINRYNLKTLREALKKTIEIVGSGDFDKELQEAATKEDIEKVYSDGKVNCYRALTKEGNVLLGRGGGHRQINKWCTARDDEHNMFDKYRDSIIYVAIFNDDTRIQFNITRRMKRLDEVKDEANQDVPSNNPYWLVIRALPFVQESYNISLERIWYYTPMMTTWEDFVDESISRRKPIGGCLTEMRKTVGGDRAAGPIYRKNLAYLMSKMENCESIDYLLEFVEWIGNIFNNELMVLAITPKIMQRIDDVKAKNPDILSNYADFVSKIQTYKDHYTKYSSIK